jgi:thiosulfate/3-mercaptopyruvate sulfurtransferase
MRDLKSPFPNMLPDLAHFVSHCKINDIKTSDRVVFYDHSGTMYSTRAFWIFTVYGHKNV